MGDSTGNYKSWKINIGVVIKNAEMFKFLPDYLKTKKICKHAVEKLSFPIRNVSDQYNSQQMCDKIILENGGILESGPDYYKNQEMCYKATDNYPHALTFVPNCYIIKKA